MLFRSCHMESIHSDMEMIVAQAICKEITLAEMQELVQQMYDTFEAGKTDSDE